MEALAETHDGSVEMINTSIVRIHQHGGCAGGGETGLMDRARGGLTTKIHACVDTNGLPVRIELTTGEAHDNRLVTNLLSDFKSGAMLLADRGYDADWIRAFAGEYREWANIPPKRNRKDPVCLAHTRTASATWLSASSTGSSSVGASRPGMTNSPQTTRLIKLASIRIWLRAYEGVDAPPTASMCQSGDVEHHLREASVSEVIIIGLDIAKHVFHVHGADERGRAIISKRISRGKLLDFFAAQPSCKVALETCGGAHHWARQLT